MEDKTDKETKTLRKTPLEIITECQKIYYRDDLDSVPLPSVE